MRNKIIYFLSGIVLATGAISANAQSSVASVPQGMINFSLIHNTTTYLSLPLTKNSSYTGSVAEVTTNTISVDDVPGPFTTNLSSAAAPYFIRFLSGNETGRVLLITGNTVSTLTLDTTDNGTGEAVALTTTSFDVEAGDTFEIFPGDTLASVFGAGTPQHPLRLTGGSNVIASDTVTFYTSVTTPQVTYFFNTSADYWEQYGTTANANNTIIYPFSSLSITRRTAHPDMNLVLGGRVTPVSVLTKVIGRGTVYDSTHYPIDVTLSQLQFGAHWTMGTDVLSADTISVWNAALGQFDTYYQKPDTTWRKYPDAVTDQSNFTITAGNITTIAKRAAVSGASSYIKSTLPYSLN